jgi:SAM-dependent methyltransferase
MNMGNEWDQIARRRREQIETGRDLTFSKVFVPIYTSLISALEPSSVLEIGIGTGHLALTLSGLAQHYVGIDPSSGMMEEARQVLQGKSIELEQCSIEEFQSSVEFDLVISHLCLQTTPDCMGFLAAVAESLNEQGVYLISIPHPAFFNEYKKIVPSAQFDYMTEHSAFIDFSITLDPQRQIRGVPYSHRPLSFYFAEFMRANLTISMLKEVYPPKDVQLLYGAKWRTPRYLIFGGSKRESEMSEIEKRLVAFGMIG